MSPTMFFTWVTSVSKSEDIIFPGAGGGWLGGGKQRFCYISSCTRPFYVNWQIQCQKKVGN